MLPMARVLSALNAKWKQSNAISIIMNFQRTLKGVNIMEKLEKVYHGYGSSLEPVAYPEEHKLHSPQRILRISLYRQGIKNWEAYIRTISDAKLFELIYNTIKEGE